MEKITLLFGTGNAAKLQLMKDYTKNMEGIELVGLKELPYSWEEPEESGKEPLENARQKALCYYRTCHIPVLSADSGLFIEGLSDEEQPGVHVRRVNGKILNDEEMRAHYKKIAEQFGGRCVAQYKNAVCLVFSEEEIYTSQSEDLSWEKFYLTTDERPQQMEGFPLDSISADFQTGNHFYDFENKGAVENDGNGFVRFLRKALAEHEKKTTRRLYYENAYQKQFEAQVVSCQQTEGGYEIVLDQTCFYPEGGGQPCDIGSLYGEEQQEEIAVWDVQEGGKTVRHICDKPLEPGTSVQGKIDWARRLMHMREHSGEHILSGIICKTHGYSNIGFHMGKDFVTIDFNGMLTQEDIAAAEKAANDKILEDVEILAEYPDEETLRKLDYRSKKELTGDIRIVTVPGADCCACCGTHVKRTGEIGPIKVIGTEHYKNGIRLNILIGQKTLNDYAQRFENIRKISTLLSVKPENTAEAVDKLTESMNELKMEYATLKMQLLEQKVEAIREGDKSALLFERGLTPVDVRKLADRLQEKVGFAAVFCGDDEEGYKYVIVSKNLDVAAFGKELNQALNGRGGGKNPMIQGSVAAKRQEIEAFLSAKELC